MTNGWQPIETAPRGAIGKESPAMLVWDGHKPAVAHNIQYKFGKRLYWWVHDSYGYNEDGEIMNPTHWMELPAGPLPGPEESSR